MIKTYTMLTKPGIIMGNIVTTAGGFALASRGNIDFGLFFATLLGLALIIASACVFNNYIDREIDRKMARTKNRALAKGLISGKNAIAFATLLGILGTFILATYTNTLTVMVALGGFLVYVILYGILKLRTIYGTLIGSIAGAVPPVVGYCAVSNTLDMGAFLLFMVLVLWQMPHFLAIAMYRLDDYAAASIPVLPLTKGMDATKKQIFLYIIAFMATALMLPVFGYTGNAYLALVAVLGIAWLAFCFKGFKSNNDRLWARKMFLFSLVVVMAFSVMISVDAG